MRCFGYGSEKCGKPATHPDYETPPIFIDPENPDGPKVRPAHCAEHHARLIAARDENEASWRRSVMR